MNNYYGDGHTLCMDRSVRTLYIYVYTIYIYIFFFSITNGGIGAGFPVWLNESDSHEAYIMFGATNARRTRRKIDNGLDSIRI